MAKFDAQQVLRDMVDAARDSLGDTLPETYCYVEDEIKKIAKTVYQVETQLVCGKIDAESARLIIDSLVNAAKTVELTGEGIVVVEAEKAINAALAVLKNAIKAVA
jgi:hypothetical protein